MKLAMLKSESGEEPALQTPEGWLPLRAIGSLWPGEPPRDLQSLIEIDGLALLAQWERATNGGKSEASKRDLVSNGAVRFAPLLRRPHKIWGIGLNYREHAADLSEVSPTAEPASFMKPDTAIVGPGDPIEIPRLSKRTTGEAELGIVIGRRCRDVPREDWLGAVAGFTTVLDMTAEDILRRNPRNLTQSKSFDTFISLGPVLLTPDEIPDVLALRVSTVINDHVHAENVVSNMTFPPDLLVAYHSQIMTLLPGDLISTGTPGAAPLSHGDVLEARIEGFPALVNPVVDLKCIPEEAPPQAAESAPAFPWA